MKKFLPLTAAAVLGLAIGGFAIAQNLHGVRGHRVPAHLKNASSLGQHLSEAYHRIAAFDANKDGRIDEMERASIAKALAEGTVQIPDHTPSHGGHPSVETILGHIPGVYASIAPYDENQDGALDEMEQSALKTAIERGELPFPHGQNTNGGSRH